MPLSLDTRKIEILDDAVVESLRSMTPAQRLAISFECKRTMRLRMAGHLLTRNPDWSDAQVQAEIARRMTRRE